MTLQKILDITSSCGDNLRTATTTQSDNDSIQ
jgi:hypothetical protein